MLSDDVYARDPSTSVVTEWTSYVAPNGSVVQYFWNVTGLWEVTYDDYPFVRSISSKTHQETDPSPALLLQWGVRAESVPVQLGVRPPPALQRFG